MDSILSNRRKAQTNVVSAVIITGLLAAAILTVYTWGVPMLQKQEDISNIDVALEDMKAIAENVEVVANKGGSRYSRMEIDGLLEVNPANNSFVYNTKSSKAYVATEKWVNLRENDMRGIPGIMPDDYGIKGSDNAGVIIGKAEESGNRYMTIFKLFFRELVDINSKRGYQINLTMEGPKTAQSGKRKVKVELADTKTIPGGSSVDGVLEEKIVEVTIE